MAQGGENIKISVRDWMGNGLNVVVNSKNPLTDVQAAYCAKFGKDTSTIKWVFNKKEVAMTETPEKLQMTNGAKLHVMAETEGGF